MTEVTVSVGLNWCEIYVMELFIKINPPTINSISLQIAFCVIMGHENETPFWFKDGLKSMN